jgi:ParB family transcriptional regulator, chromosome partitioning protein
VTDNPRMVTKKPKGLGMGLEALLGPSGGSVTLSAEERAERVPSTLRLDRLRPGKYQPRTRMDEGSLYELAQSIKSQGVMQPILVRPIGTLAGEPSLYEIIAGERRFRAAQLAGLDEVPVLVKVVPDESAAVMALIENIQREDLNPLEEAHGLKRLVDEFNLTHEQAAQAVGRSRSAASNLLRLLNLTDSVQKMLLANDLDMGHARALLGLTGAEQVMVANQIVARKLSVRDAEKLVAHHDVDAPAMGGAGGSGRKVRGQQPAPKSGDIAALQERLADHLAASVDIRLKPGGKAGEIAVSFHSLDDLEGVLQRLGLPNA